MELSLLALHDQIEEAKRQETGSLAELCWREASFCSTQLHGPTHDTTAFCMSNWAQQLLNLGDPVRSIEVLKPLLEKLIMERGLYSSGLEFLCWSLANACKAVGDSQASYRYWKMSADSSQRTKGEFHATTIRCLQQAARALARQRLFNQALPLFVAVYDRWLQSKGDNALNLAYAARDLATCNDMLRRYEDALACWEAAVKGFGMLAHPEHAKALECLKWTRQRQYDGLHSCRDKQVPGKSKRRRANPHCREKSV